MSAPFPLKDNEHVVGTLGFVDAAGNAVAGAVPDAGSVAASFSDGTECSVVVNPDDTILVTALGPITQPDTLSVTASLGGVTFTATQEFDVSAGAPTAVGLTFGTPAAN